LNHDKGGYSTRNEQPNGNRGNCHNGDVKARGGATVPWGWAAAILGFTASIFLLFVFQNVLFMVGFFIIGLTNPFSLLKIQWSFSLQKMTYEPSLTLGVTPELLAFSTIGELALIIIPVLYLKIKEIPLRELGFKFKDRRTTMIDILIGALAGIGMMWTANVTSTLTTLTLQAILQLLYGPFYGIVSLLLAEEVISRINAPFSAANPAQLAILLLSVTLLVAPCEEVSTRGFLQQGLESSWGKWKGLLAAALIFSLLHVIFYPQSASTIGYPNIGIISILLALPSYIILSITLGALLQIREYRIITTIAAHATYMTLLVILLSSL